MRSWIRWNLAVLASLFAASTAMPSEWASTYGGFDDESAASIAVRAAGGARVAGSAELFGTQGRDVWLLEVGADGGLISQRAYGGVGDESARVVLERPGGGAIVAGTTTSFGSGDSDIWLFEVGADGVVDWQRRYGGSEGEIVVSLVEVAGGYVLGGTTSSFGAGDSDLWVLRIDTDGDVISQFAYGGIDAEALGDLQATPDGGLILAAFTWSFDLPDGGVVGNGDFWILKLDASGAIQWEKSFGLDFGGNQNAESPPSVWPTADGGYVVAGTTAPLPAGNSDAWILKLDANGGIEWQQFHETLGDYIVHGIEQTADLGYALWGSLSHGAGWLMKLDALGAVSWQKRYSGPGFASDEFFAVQQIADGGYLAAGESSSLGVGGRDAWVLELDANGNVPDCEAVAPTFGSVTESFEIGVDSAATVTATAVTGVATSAFVAETSALQGNGCELVPADWIDLQQTGQTTIHGVGDDGELRAGADWPSPRFEDNVDGTQTDRLTGLMWMKDASCQETIGYDPNGDGRLTWTQALDFVSDVNSGVHDISACASYTRSYVDWRMPNIKELETLLHAEQANVPAWLMSQGFQNVKSIVSGTHWSSTTHTFGPNRAVTLGLMTHEVRTTAKGGELFLWMVRSGQTELPDPSYPANVSQTGQVVSYYPGDDADLQRGVAWPGHRYQDQGDGTVIDSLTGLMWLKDAGCLLRPNWPNSLNQVSQFNLDPDPHACEDYSASYSDWRLPNRIELRSLVDYSLFWSAVPDSAPFVGIGGGLYWTSTTLASNANLAWGVAIASSSGGTQQFTKTIYGEGIWPVRGAPVPEPSGTAATLAGLIGLLALSRARRTRMSTPSTCVSGRGLFRG